MLLILWVEDAEGFKWNKNGAAKENVISISGLGDDAYYTKHGGSLILNVKKGDLCVIVTWLVALDLQKVMDAEKIIAEQVLSEI